ncbi:MAG: hypothetical protein HeimC2_14120 [Candidatus Heimdallarchaeota archaeon LC_2]|nr:MAG: hypothetical protein HeimC2_14120 [Candidatus Heimdallarchaeota archaeon LC_2]
MVVMSGAILGRKLKVKNEFIYSVIPCPKEKKNHMEHAVFGIGCFDSYNIDSSKSN